MSQPYVPRFLQPDPDGQLSNSLTPTIKSRYMTSRGSADPAGQMRLSSYRISSLSAGAGFAPALASDTGWIGQPTITALPAAVKDSAACAIWDRVYVLGGADGSGVPQAAVYSASFNGGSVGTWRRERDMAVRPSPNGGLIPSGRYGHAATAATFGTSGGWGSAGLGTGGQSWIVVYGGFDQYDLINSSPSMIAAPILGDGVLGNWITLSYSGWTRVAYGHLLAVPNIYVTTSLVLSGGLQSNAGTATSNAWSTMVRNAPASAQSGDDWDVPGGASQWWRGIGVGFPAVAGHNVSYDWANSTLLAFNGSDNSAVGQAGFWWLGYGVNAYSWTYQSLGSNWTNGTSTGIGGARNNAGLVYTGAQKAGTNGGSPTSTAYTFGGTTAFGVGDRASSIAQVAVVTLTWNGSGVPSANWVASANPFGTATTGCRAVFAEHNGAQGFGYPPWLDANLGRITLLGGATAASAAIATVQSTSIAVAGSGSYHGAGGDIAAWRSGVGGGLDNTALGAGGSIVASTDLTAPAGSQDVTQVYAANGVSSTLANGDQLRFDVQYTDKNGGDASPVRSTILRLGAAPTVTSITQTGAAGQPTIAWNFNAGSGGGTQLSWRCVVTRNSDAVVMFDSGVRLGQTNQVQCQLAPMLAAVAYTATVTLVATDSVVSGATATVSGTLVFTPSLGTVPGTPTGVAVAPDSVNKWYLLTGTALVNTTAIRVYYRELASGQNFRLLAEVAQAGAGAFSYKLMDKMSLGRSLEFGVSALGGTAANESAMAASVNGVIPADLDSPSGWLHLAGQPLTGAAGCGVKGQAQYDLQAAHDGKVLVKYNGGRAVLRNGVQDIRRLSLEILSVNSTSNVALENLRDQLLLGGVVWWRDRLGVTLPMGLESPVDVKTLHPNHRNWVMRLVQVDDTYSPYLVAGSAVGIPTLANGSIPPLNDAVEQVA